MFGRLIGQWMSGLSPGIFAMVGAGAFLAGVSRMTISLGVIMFELTGELEYILPNMIAILMAKWVADAISAQGVYDVAQTVLGHPFLDARILVLGDRAWNGRHGLTCDGGGREAGRCLLCRTAVRGLRSGQKARLVEASGRRQHSAVVTLIYMGRA